MFQHPKNREIKHSDVLANVCNCDHSWACEEEAVLIDCVAFMTIFLSNNGSGSSTILKIYSE